nr:helix-turn-helix domain-containing protein [Beijerinckia sp. L45]
MRSLRERDHLSQAAFAGYLNLTADDILQLERGLRRPTGAILVLLNVIRRKGLEVIL